MTFQSEFFSRTTQRAAVDMVFGLNLDAKLTSKFILYEVIAVSLMYFLLFVPKQLWFFLFYCQLKFHTVLGPKTSCPKPKTEPLKISCVVFCHDHILFCSVSQAKDYSSIFFFTRSKTTGLREIVLALLFASFLLLTGASNEHFLVFAFGGIFTGLIVFLRHKDKIYVLKAKILSTSGLTSGLAETFFFSSFSTENIGSKSGPKKVLTRLNDAWGNKAS